MTSVHVGELNTSVVDDGGSAGPDPAPPSGSPPWEELDRARRAEAELVRLRARTSAEGFGV